MTSPYDIGIGALVMTPGMASDEIGRLNAEITAAESEIEKAYFQPSVTMDSPITTFRHQVWFPFLSQWKIFRDGHSSWTDNMWGGTWDEIQGFRQRFNDLFAKAKALGVGFTAPTPSAPPPPTPTIAGGLSSAVKWGGLLIGVVIAYRLLRSGRD